MQGFTISNLDIGIIAIYFVIVLAIGFRVARRTSSGDDLFLAGRRLAWPAIGFSLFASNISSASLIGLSGAAYSWGIAVANYEWMAGLVFTRSSLADGMENVRWYSDYRLLSGGLLLLTVATVIAFW